MTDNSLWVEKYRPQNFSQVAYHEKVIDLLRYFIESGSLPHLFFYGPSGTGKTSTIVSLAKEIYGKNYKKMALHLNASEDRGKEYIQKEIVDFISTKGLFVSYPYKMVIMDEADSMSRESQIILKDIINIYSGRVRFCLIGNYQHALIPELCTYTLKILFPPIPKEHIFTVAHQILIQEGFSAEDDSLDYIYSINGGDLRKYINVLQAVCFRSEEKHLSLQCIKQFLKQYNLANVRDFAQSLQGDSFDLIKVFHSVKTMLLLKSQDFLWWMNRVSQILIEHISEENIAVFCKKVAEIEYNSSFLVNYDIQLYSFIAVCKQYIDSVNIDALLL